jgi:hypothetical protein
MSAGSARRGGLKKAMSSDVVGIRRAVEAYVEVVESLTLAAEDRLARLPSVLDSLAIAVRDITYEFDETDYAEKPAEDYQAAYQVVGRHFPTLGYYNIPLSITREIGEASIGIGDAIDDIVDILFDLKDVLSRFENTSVSDALWYLNENYRSHWGLHLRELQLYLHVLASGAEECSVRSGGPKKL